MDLELEVHAERYFSGALPDRGISPAPWTPGDVMVEPASDSESLRAGSSAGVGLGPCSKASGPGRPIYLPPPAPFRRSSPGRGQGRARNPGVLRNLRAEGGRRGFGPGASPP